VGDESRWLWAVADVSQGDRSEYGQLGRFGGKNKRNSMRMLNRGWLACFRAAIQLLLGFGLIALRERPTGIGQKGRGQLLSVIKRFLYGKWGLEATE
jgi:hypothetical protein